MADQDNADVGLFHRVNLLNSQTTRTCEMTKRMIDETRTLLDRLLTVAQQPQAHLPKSGDF